MAPASLTISALDRSFGYAPGPVSMQGAPHADALREARTSSRAVRTRASASPQAADKSKSLAFARSAAIGLIVPAVLLLLWSLASSRGWIAAQILPPPALVWQTLADLARSGDLWFHTSLSLQRVAWGFAAGALLGIAVGIAVGLSARAQACVEPLFIALAQVPAIGWIPLAMLLVGIDEALKVIVIAKAAMVPVAVNTWMGIHAVPRRFREVGTVLTFSPWDTLRRIVLPAAWPSVFTGIRYGLANAWMALVAVELLASYEGLGYLIVWGRQMFQLDLVLAAMLVIGTIGFAMDWSLAKVEARLQRWKLEA